MTVTESYLTNTVMKASAISGILQKHQASGMGFLLDFSLLYEVHSLNKNKRAVYTSYFNSTLRCRLHGKHLSISSILENRIETKIPLPPSAIEQIVNTPPCFPQPK